jgi:hypothetical protein
LSNATHALRSLLKEKGLSKLSCKRARNFI